MGDSTPLRSVPGEARGRSGAPAARTGGRGVLPPTRQPWARDTTGGGRILMAIRARTPISTGGGVPLAALLLLLAGPARALTVAVTPPESSVAPGAGFDVSLSVVVADSAFNGFDAVVQYDPAALTFVQASPVGNQQGCLMTGQCSDACGNTFHVFHAAADSLAIADVLMCNGISLTGPGQLYTLHFVASNTPQVTWIRLRSTTFYNAGRVVGPVVARDAAVGVGVQLAVPGAPRRPMALQLKASPNPSHGVTLVRVDTPARSDQALWVSDVLGRTVRRLERGTFEAGTRTVAWDGRDDAGRRLPAGLYLVRLGAGGDGRQVRVALLP